MPTFLVDWFFRWVNWCGSRRDSLARLQAEIEKLRDDRLRDKNHYESIIKIRETEMAAMAEVIARDRERVQAETAGFVAQRESAIRPQQVNQ